MRGEGKEEEEGERERQREGNRVARQARWRGKGGEEEGGGKVREVKRRRIREERRRRRRRGQRWRRSVARSDRSLLMFAWEIYTLNARNGSTKIALGDWAAGTTWVYSVFIADQ